MPTAPYRPDPADLIDWTPVDIDEARAALDEPPAGVGRLQQLMPDYWATRRRPPQPSDRALTGQAIDWLLRMPPEGRPEALCARFPRLANRLAAAWDDLRVRRAVLDELLTDRRGTRLGFPPAVRDELRLLAGR